MVSTTIDVVTLEEDFTDVNQLINRLCEVCWIEYKVFKKSVSVLETNNKNDTAQSNVTSEKTHVIA